MIEAVLFDLDGTLIDSTGDVCSAVNSVRATYDLPALSQAQVSPLIGGGLGSLLANTLPERDGHVCQADREVFLSFYGEHLLDTTRPYRALTEWMREIPVQRALVTNKPRRFGLPIIHHLDLRFDTVVFGDDGYGRKPTGQPILTVLERLAIEPCRALMLGDSDYDLKAAGAAGVSFLAVPWSSQSHIREYAFKEIEWLREWLGY